MSKQFEQRDPTASVNTTRFYLKRFAYSLVLNSQKTLFCELIIQIELFTKIFIYSSIRKQIFVFRQVAVDCNFPKNEKKKKETLRI